MSDPPRAVDPSIGYLPTPITPTDRRLTAAEFQGLAEVPLEFEWFETSKNPGTKRIYKNAGFYPFYPLARARARYPDVQNAIRIRRA